MFFKHRVCVLIELGERRISFPVPMKHSSSNGHFLFGYSWAVLYQKRIKHIYQVRIMNNTRYSNMQYDTQLMQIGGNCLNHLRINVTKTLQALGKRTPFMDDCLTMVSFLLFLFFRLITFPSRAFTVRETSRPLFLRPVYTPTHVKPQKRPEAPNSERRPYLPQISQQQNSSASGGPSNSFFDEDSRNTPGIVYFLLDTTAFIKGAGVMWPCRPH